jgi:serine protease
MRPPVFTALFLDLVFFVSTNSKTENSALDSFAPHSRSITMSTLYPNKGCGGLQQALRCAIAALSLGAATAPLFAQSTVAPPAQQIVVRFNERMQSDGRGVQSKVESWSAYSGQSLTFVRATGDGDWIMRLNKSASATTAQNTAAAIQANDVTISFAIVDAQLSQNVNDQRFGEQWSMQAPNANVAAINAPAVWNMLATLGVSPGQGTAIAVLDSGILPHPDLTQNIIAGFDFYGNDVFDLDSQAGRDSDPYDMGIRPTGSGGPCSRAARGEDPPVNCNAPIPYHGTHVAGIAAATANNGIGIAGVSYGSKILPVRVLNNGYGYSSDIADAIRWVAGGYVPQVGAFDTPHPNIGTARAQVINLSLGTAQGTACVPYVQDAISFASSRGVSVVVSAGNDSSGNPIGNSPNNCHGVISVANLTGSGNRAFDSNYRQSLSIAAPGENILSTFLTNMGFVYERQSGTSMAAPHVAGVVALIKSARPDLTPSAIRTALSNGATPFPAQSNCWQNQLVNGVMQRISVCGAGMLNAANALASALGLPIPPANIPLQHGLGGHWHNPSVQGQGIMFEVNTLNNFVFGTWNTYDFAGSTQTGVSGQRWYAMYGALVPGSSDVQLQIYQSTGGAMSASTPPSQNQLVGGATLSFQGCEAGKLDYSFDNQQSGSILLERLGDSALCAGIQNGIAPATQSLSAAGIGTMLNGAWMPVPGQGLHINVLPSALTSNLTVVAMWSTFTPLTATNFVSEPRWYTLVGNYLPGSRRVDNMRIYQNVGGALNALPNTSPIDVGGASLEFLSCGTVRMQYQLTNGQSNNLLVSRLGQAEFCIE